MVHSQPNIELQVHFWVEVAFEPWDHNLTQVYDLKAWGQPQAKNAIVFSYLGKNELIWDFGLPYASKKCIY